MWILFYLVLALSAAVYAAAQQKNVIVWAVLALLITPLLTFVILSRQNSGAKCRNQDFFSQRELSRKLKHVFLSKYLDQQERHQQNPLLRETFDKLMQGEQVCAKRLQDTLVMM